MKALSCLALLLASGCGGPTNGTPDLASSPDLASAPADLASQPPDLSNFDDLAPPADLTPGPPDLAPCNALGELSLGVAGNYTPLKAPTGMGGNITDGTYALVDWVVFTGQGGQQGPIGSTYFQTIVVANGTFQSVSHTDKNPEGRSSGTFTTLNTTVTSTSSCPPGPPQDFAYSAYPMALTIIAPPNNGMTTLFTFARK